MKKEVTVRAVLGAFLLSGVITAVYFLIVYGSIPFIYDINDDVAMRNLASGAITGTPDAHLYFIKYVLGLFISGLYSFLPGFDWYGIVLIGIILFSLWMILYRGLSAQRSVIWKAVYTVIVLLLFTSLCLKHLTDFQWTVSAAVSGAAGLFLFYTAGEGPTWKTVLEEGISVFLLLLTYAVRSSVFKMVLPLAALAFCWRYFSREKWGKLPVRLRHFAVPLALCAGLFIISGVESAAYASPEWTQFRAYNSSRSKIMDYYGVQDYDEDPGFYESVGLSREETENLQRYSLYLADDPDGEKLSALARRGEELYDESHPLSVRISSAFEMIYNQLTRESYVPANIFALCMIALCLGLCAGRNRKELFFSLAFAALWGAYWFYLSFRNRLPDRVGFALYLTAFTVMAAVLYRVLFLDGKPAELKSGDSDNRAASADILLHRLGTALLTLGTVLVLTLVSVMSWQSVRDSNISRRDYNLRFLEVGDYMADHPENVYFMTTFSIETFTDNFTVRRDFEFTNLLSLGGWHTYSPVEDIKCEKLGISEPRTDIVEKDNVYVISLKNVNLRYMDRYYESLYGDAYLGRELTDTLDFGDQVFEVYDFSVEK